VGEIPAHERGSYANKTIIGVDPNMSDLWYAVSGPNKGDTRWRYTQMGRKNILKVKRYSKIRIIKSKNCIT